MWKVVTSSNLNSLLKLFFYSPILTNNNLFLKIYYENIVVTFLKQDFLFFILFLLSLFSFHPYVCLFVFFFFLHYLLHTHCPISIPTPFFFFFSLIQVSRTFQHSHSLFFFSSSLSLFFFFNLIPEQSSPTQSKWVIFVPKQLAQLEPSLIFIPNAV